VARPAWLDGRQNKRKPTKKELLEGREKTGRVSSCTHAAANSPHLERGNWEKKRMKEEGAEPSIRLSVASINLRESSKERCKVERFRGERARWHLRIKSKSLAGDFEK